MKKLLLKKTKVEPLFWLEAKLSIITLVIVSVFSKKSMKRN